MSGADYQPGAAAADQRTARATTDSVSGAGQADVTVTFDVPFVDAGITVVASIVEDEAGESLRVRRIRSVTASGCVVNVVNNGLGSATGTVQVIAVHD